MARRESRAEVARRLNYEDAVRRRASYVKSMESGEVPSALYKGDRVAVVARQDHPLVGRRYRLSFGIVVWVSPDEISDMRGEAPDLPVPADFAARMGWTPTPA